MFKRNIFKILAAVFFLLAGATFIYSNRNKSIQLIKPIKRVQPTSTVSTRLNPIPSDSVQFHPSTTIAPTQAIVLPTNTLVPPSPAEASAKEGQPQGLKVSLSIGGSSVETIDLPAGANQCDVLTQALSQGKIQSLNMRYNNDMGTNAVYQINGIGKENTVWWIFKINGQSPSQGCSYIKVNDGDNTEWNYLGNQ